MRYIDDLLLRDRAPSGSGTLDERLYFLADANWNVTAVVDAAGAVQERIEYTPYGLPQFLAPSFGNRTNSSFNIRYSYTGREWLPELALYYFRNRWYSPSVGVFTSRDPIGFEGIEWSLYEYVNGIPNTSRDPMGLTGDCRKNFATCIEAAGDEAAACRAAGEDDWVCIAAMVRRQANCAAARAVCIMRTIRPRFKLPLCPTILSFPPEWHGPGPDGQHTA